MFWKKASLDKEYKEYVDFFVKHEINDIYQKLNTRIEELSSELEINRSLIIQIKNDVDRKIDAIAKENKNDIEEAVRMMYKYMNYKSRKHKRNKKREHRD